MRPCADHIAGYRIFFQGEYGALGMLTKGRWVSPETGPLLAVPYRQDGMLHELEPAEASQLASLLAAQACGEELDLPAGMVLLACDPQGQLRVACDGGPAPELADPGYEPVPADQLLGHLRAEFMVSPARFDAIHQRAELALAAAARTQGQLLATQPGAGAGVAPDPSTAALLTHTARRQWPACRALDEALAPAWDLPWDPVQREALDALALRRELLYVAIGMQRTLAELEAVWHDPPTNGVTPFEDLATRPDLSVRGADALHLLVDEGEYDYDDSTYSEARCARALHATVDAAAGDRLLMYRQAHELLAAKGHTDELCTYGDFGEPRSRLALQRIPVQGAPGRPGGPRGPVTFEHGCAYVLVTGGGPHQWDLETPWNLQYHAAYPDRALATAMLAAGTDQHRYAGDQWLPDAEELDAWRDEADRAGELEEEEVEGYVNHGWSWVRYLPGPIVGCAPWADTNAVVVAVPLPTP